MALRESNLNGYCPKGILVTFWKRVGFEGGERETDLLVHAHCIISLFSSISSLLSSVFSLIFFFSFSCFLLLCFSFTLWIMDVDTVSYRPVRPEFFVPVDEPVPKHLQNVPLKIPAYTGHTGVYRTFRPEKRNSAGTKTERKNRRNAWFEQTPVQQVATTLTLPIRSSSSLFFIFFFFSSVVLLCCSDFFSFFAEQWTLLCGISFFILYLIWNFLSPFTRD